MARSRTMTLTRRQMLWRVNLHPEGRIERYPDSQADGSPESTADFLTRVDMPLPLAINTLHDTAVDLATDGYLDVTLDSRNRIQNIQITGVGRDWVKVYFKTKPGKKEHRQFTTLLRTPYADRPRRRRKNNGEGARQPGTTAVHESTARRFHTAVQALGVPTGDGWVVVERHAGDQPVYQAIGDEAGWARRSVGVVVSKMEAERPDEIRVKRWGRNIQSVAVPAQPVEVEQPVRPDERYSEPNDSAWNQDVANALLRAAVAATEKRRELEAQVRDLTLQLAEVQGERDALLTEMDKATAPPSPSVEADVARIIAELSS